ncbi:hypothetical protein F4604DRAFT_1915873 [Suillus subluteus]|nr:hypothetical protein F4604DRAFT_1915873 [Suillus subluteus]
MPPLPIHKQPAAHLAKAINKFMEAISYDKLLIDITMHLNHHIQNKDSTNIPDLHLTVTAQPPEDMESDEMVMAKSVSKWVGESIRILNTLSSYPSSSGSNGNNQKKRILFPNDFKSLKFGLVEIKSHTWINISEINYSVYKRSMDVHFNFNNKNSATFTEGTLYPVLQMDDIERMLDAAAESLKEYVVLLMEGMGLEQSAIQSARNSCPMFEPVWGAALNSISSAIYLTAYCRYLDWCNHKYDKHKTTHIMVQSSGSSTQPTSTSLSSVPMTSSSNATTYPSSDAMASSSARLSLDVQPEPSTKKSRIQSEDRREESKAKPKKVRANGSASGSKGKGSSHH